MNYCRGFQRAYVDIPFMWTILIMVMTLSTSCRQSTTKTTHTASPSVNEDNWQKMKECSAQADVINSRIGGALPDYEKSVQELARSLSTAQELGAIADSVRSHSTVSAMPITVDESSLNHYSLKYGKCFVKLAYRLTSVAPSVGNHLDRTNAILLVDAFEGGLYADLDFSSCYIGGKPADCAETERDIDEAMQN